MSSLEQWLSRPQPRPDAAIRLVCFHHAGGSSGVFRLWSRSLPAVDVWAVRLPGRETRLHEPPAVRVAEVVEPLAELFERCGGGTSTVLFGHSMGALLAFELARELRRRDVPGPELLLVSGRCAPSVVRAYGDLADVWQLPSEELLEWVQARYGAIAPELLREPELIEQMLPMLRADLALVSRHRHLVEAPLACPIRAYGGTEDVGVPRSALEAWAEQTWAEFRCRQFPGDHFYLRSEPGRRWLLDDVSEALLQLRARQDTS